MEKLSLEEWATRELFILERVPEKVGAPKLLRPFRDEIIALARRMDDQNPGLDRALCAKQLEEAVFKLTMGQALAPITGERWEWQEIKLQGKIEGLEVVAYNIRNPDILKVEGGRVLYTEAIKWKSQQSNEYLGYAWTPKGEPIGSAHFVKAFPFYPETLVYDVITYQPNKESRTYWKSKIVYPNTLDWAWKRYDKLPVEQKEVPVQ